MDPCVVTQALRVSVRYVQTLMHQEHIGSRRTVSQDQRLSLLNVPTGGRDNPSYTMLS